jgi:hypothetical protein
MESREGWSMEGLMAAGHRSPMAELLFREQVSAGEAI